MRVFIACLISLGIIFVISFVIMSLISSKWHPKGLVKGKLVRCPEKPNCVCSEYPEDKKHFVEPIKISDGIMNDVVDIIESIIRDLGGKIVSKTENYIAGTFKSPFFKFTDDLEIRIDRDERLIHIRSAARVGYSDMGVNKRRVEVLVEQFNNTKKK